MNASAARFALGLAAVLSSGTAWASGSDGALVTADEGDGLRVTSGYLNAKFSLTQPGLLFLGVDSLGEGKVGHGVLAREEARKSAWNVTHSVNERSCTATYLLASAPEAKWQLIAQAKSLVFESKASAGGKSEPLVLTFDTHKCYSTLLGLFDAKGAISLPAILHLPGFGTLRIQIRIYTDEWELS